MNAVEDLQIDPGIVHQTIDGEAVIINLESGCYYSLTGTAAEIWALLERGVSAAVLAETLRTRYEAEAGAIEESVASFLAELSNEGLVTTTIPVAPIKSKQQASPTTHARPSYQGPVLQKYTDMQDLLLIDPIHEVAESGWPLKPSDKQPPS